MHIRGSRVMRTRKPGLAKIGTRKFSIDGGGDDLNAPKLISKVHKIVDSGLVPIIKDFKDVEKSYLEIEKTEDYIENLTKNVSPKMNGGSTYTESVGETREILKKKFEELRQQVHDSVSKTVDAEEELPGAVLKIQEVRKHAEKDIRHILSSTKHHVIAQHERLSNEVKMEMDKYINNMKRVKDMIESKDIVVDTESRIAFVKILKHGLIKNREIDQIIRSKRKQIKALLLSANQLQPTTAIGYARTIAVKIKAMFVEMYVDLYYAYTTNRIFKDIFTSLIASTAGISVGLFINSIIGLFRGQHAHPITNAWIGLAVGLVSGSLYIARYIMNEHVRDAEDIAQAKADIENTVAKRIDESIKKLKKRNPVLAGIL